jgi:hypothetical protein
LERYRLGCRLVVDAIGNAAPGLAGGAAELAARYAQRQLRSV